MSYAIITVRATNWIKGYMKVGEKYTRELMLYAITSNGTMRMVDMNTYVN